MKANHLAALALCLMYVALVGCDRRDDLNVTGPPVSNPPQIAPEQVSPYPGTQGAGEQTMFWWQETEEAQYYHLQIAAEAAFTQVVYDEPGITGHLSGYSGLEPGASYFWRVRGRNQDGDGPWSEVWPFTRWDGSSPISLEGTWRFVSGGYYPVFPNYFFIAVEVTGIPIMRLEGDSFKIEGPREIYRHGEASTDTFYQDYVVEEGTFTLDGNMIDIVIPALYDPVLAGLTAANYSITRDTLTISYEPAWCGAWNGLHMEGQLVFRRE